MSRKGRRRNRQFGGALPLDPGAALPGSLGPAQHPDPESPPNLPPSELWEIGEDADDQARPRKERQQEDLEVLCGIFGAPGRPGPQGQTGLTAGEGGSSDQTLAFIYHKFVSVISEADVSRQIIATLPEHSQLVELAQDAWNHAEFLWSRSFARSGLGSFARDETEWGCLRGWITQRLWWSNKAYMAGKFAVELQSVDPASVSAVFGPDGLEYVVQTYDAKKHEILLQFPELAHSDNPLIATPDTFDDIGVRAVYGRHYVNYFVGGDHVFEFEHGAGFCPWVIIPCRDNTKTTGMSQGLHAQGALTRATQTLTGLNANELQRYVGLSCFHEAKRIVVRLQQLMDIAYDLLELGVRPRWKIRVQADGTQIEVGDNPGDHTVVAGQMEDVEALEADPHFEHLNVLIQYYQNQLDHVLPLAAWSATGAGPTSALDRAYISASMLNVFMPYVRARQLACQQRWDMAMRWYAVKGLSSGAGGLGMKFGRELQQGKLSLGMLTAADFQALDESKLEVTLRNLIPSDLQSTATTATMLLSNGVIDNLKALEMLGFDDAKSILRRVAAATVYKQQGIGMQHSAEAFRIEHPDEWAFAKQILDIEIDRVANQTLLQAQQVKLALHQLQAGGAAGVPQPGAGPAGPPSASMPGGPPGGSGGPVGGPPGMGHPPMPMGGMGGPPGPPMPPPPTPIRPMGPMGPGPGVQAAQAGLGGVAGGTHMPGRMPSMGGPRHLGQVAAPQMENESAALLRQMQAAARGRPQTR